MTELQIGEQCKVELKKFVRTEQILKLKFLKDFLMVSDSAKEQLRKVGLITR